MYISSAVLTLRLTNNLLKIITFIFVLQTYQCPYTPQNLYKNILIFIYSETISVHSTKNIILKKCTLYYICKNICTSANSTNNTEKKYLHSYFYCNNICTFNKNIMKKN